jgi:hypothetical protein
VAGHLGMHAPYGMKRHPTDSSVTVHQQRAAVLGLLV